MRICIYLVVGFLVLAMTSSCTRNMGQEFDVSAAKNIHVGATDMATVERYLGPPLNRESVNGQETWHYSFVHTYTAPTPTAFIPFFGPGMQGAYKGDVNSQIIYIKFKNNIVSSCVLTTTSSKMDDALMQQGSTNMIQKDCDK